MLLFKFYVIPNLILNLNLNSKMNTNQETDRTIVPYSPEEINLTCTNNDLFSEDEESQAYNPSTGTITMTTSTPANSTAAQPAYFTANYMSLAATGTTSTATTTPTTPSTSLTPAMQLHSFNPSVSTFAIPPGQTNPPIVVNPHHPRTLDPSYKVSINLRDRDFEWTGKQTHVLTQILPPGKNPSHNSNSFYQFIEKSVHTELQKLFPYNIMWASGFEFKLTTATITYQSGKQFSDIKNNTYKLPITDEVKATMEVPRIYMDMPNKPKVEIILSYLFEVTQPKPTRVTITTEEKDLIRKLISSQTRNSSTQATTTSPSSATSGPSRDPSTRPNVAERLGRPPYPPQGPKRQAPYPRPSDEEAHRHRSFHRGWESYHPRGPRPGGYQSPMENDDYNPDY